MEQDETWKMKAFIIGGIAGLLAGLGAALIFIQRAEQNEARPKLSAGEGVKVGIGVLGVLRLISDLGTKK